MSMNRDNFRSNQPPSKVPQPWVGRSGGPACRPARLTPRRPQVLHVRNLPNDATEDEVQQLCRSFGRVVRIKMSGKERTQAFVEFENMNQAMNMVSFFVGNSNPPKVGARAGVTCMGRDPLAPALAVLRPWGPAGAAAASLPAPCTPADTQQGSLPTVLHAHGDRWRRRRRRWWRGRGRRRERRLRRRRGGPGHHG